MTTSDLSSYVVSGIVSTLSLATIENIVSILAFVVAILNVIINLFIKFIEKKKKGSESHENESGKTPR